ncbi:MAG: ribosome biogenesis GTPase Der [Spirochaetaceae bacterium]|jgi:GTP-binding protein|nr:ribosome biogenesis GTPase Der [Spirochaetaceae bacterium]
MNSDAVNDTQTSSLPLVVIAGRPNVGKSTLFNRFLHKRRAITDPTPGVTRDPIREIARINGCPFLLMDTGGFKLARPDVRPHDGSAEDRARAAIQAEQTAAMDALVTQKTVSALKQATLILLLLDAEGFTAEDEEFIALLRPHSAKLLAAVNKTEGGRLEGNAWEYARFGFSDLLCISAEHGDRFPELCERIAARLGFAATNDSTDEEGPVPPDDAPPDSAVYPEAGPSAAPPEEPVPLIRVAVLGKPNTGKSTLTNRLTGTQASIVSDYAGTTRDVIEGSFIWHGRNFQILDTAGIRRKARVSENVEYYSVTRAIKTLDRCDVVFLIIDAAEGFVEQDKKIAALAAERGKGVIFVLNKWDTQEAGARVLKKAVEDMRIMFGHMAWAPVCAISARDGTGIGGLLKTAVALYGQLTRKIDTAAVNLALADWLAAFPAPSGGGRPHFKLRYMIQAGANPVRFLAFCNKPDAIPDSYLAYIRNKIRSDLAFEQIPVLLEVRESRKKWKERDT